VRRRHVPTVSLFGSRCPKSGIGNLPLVDSRSKKGSGGRSYEKLEPDEFFGSDFSSLISLADA
jgi:hypothetical protein